MHLFDVKFIHAFFNLVQNMIVAAANGGGADLNTAGSKNFDTG